MTNLQRFTVLSGCLISANGNAHGFGEQLDLQIPLWLWLGGAGLTVLLSFAVVIDFLPQQLSKTAYSVVNITHLSVVKLITSQRVLWFVRLVILAILSITIGAAIFGSQVPTQNIAPTMIWVIFWVGVTFSVIVLGNYWRLVNPFITIYLAINYLLSKAKLTSRCQPQTPPTTSNEWAAVILLCAFMWVEHLWPNPDSPRLLGYLMLAYIVLTLSAMHRKGAQYWLTHGEFFSIIFEIFGRFSPFKYEISQSGSVATLLRAPAVGLFDKRPTSSSLTILIILLLSSVTFDGWIETLLWKDFLFEFSIALGEVIVLENSILLINAITFFIFPAIFLVMFYLTCAATAGLLDSDQQLSARELMQFYVTSFVPIAIAYHFAHYLMLFLVEGQLIFSLVSDPFGFGWDLFGTAKLRTARDVISANVAWYWVVAAIIIGHMLSVYLAHVMTLELCKTKQAAIKAGTPVLILMVFYTMISLWVIAQPVSTAS